MLLTVGAAVHGVGPHGGAHLADRVLPRRIGGQLVSSLGRARAQLCGDARAFLRAPQSRTARDRHVPHDRDAAAHILRGERAPRGILADDGDLDTARGGGRLRADDAQTNLAAPGQGQHVTRAHPRKDAARLLTSLALAGARARLLGLADALAHHEILADVAA